MCVQRLLRSFTGSTFLPVKRTETATSDGFGTIYSTPSDKKVSVLFSPKLPLKMTDDLIYKYLRKDDAS